MTPWTWTVWALAVVLMSAQVKTASSVLTKSDF
jgi:hypothetical protein